MNQRGIVIVILALFTSCFVGSGAIATLSFMKAVVNGAPRGLLVDSNSQLDEAQPSVDRLPPADVPDEALLPPDDDDSATFESPAFGVALFAVYHFEKSKADPWASLQKAAKGTTIKVFNGLAPSGTNPPFIEFHDLPVAEHPVIEGVWIEKNLGLTEAVKKALPRTKRVSVFDVTLPVGGASMLQVSKIVAAFQKTTGGVIWDDDAEVYLSGETWKVQRVDSWEMNRPHLGWNIGIMEGTTEGGTTLETGGLCHFGLPELQLKNVPDDMKGQAADLLFAAAQNLAEADGPIAEGQFHLSVADIKHVRHREELQASVFKNADGAVEVMLVPGGDSSRHVTLEITFAGPGTEAVRLQAALDALFGFED